MESSATQATAAEVARAHFEALARHDLEAVRWADDVVVDITSQGIFRGRDEMKAFFAGLRSAMPDAELLIDRIVAEGDVAVVQWRWEGNFTGSAFQGIEPTGGWVQYRGCDVVEVAGDEIRRITAYVDGMEVARAIGMMPPMDSGAEKAMIQAFNLMTKARHALRERFGQ